MGKFHALGVVCHFLTCITYIHGPNMTPDPFLLLQRSVGTAVSNFVLQVQFCFHQSISWLAVSIWYYQGAELTKQPEEQKYCKFCKVPSSEVLQCSPSNVNISRSLGNSLRFCLKPCPNVKCFNVSGNLSKL